MRCMQRRSLLLSSLVHSFIVAFPFRSSSYIILAYAYFAPTPVWEFLSSAMVAFYASSALLFSALLATGFANAFNIDDIKQGSE